MQPVSDIRAAVDSGAVVRSWPMRGTLHFVAPEDLRWMLDPTAERFSRMVAGRHTLPARLAGPGPLGREPAADGGLR